MGITVGHGLNLEVFMGRTVTDNISKMSPFGYKINTTNSGPGPENGDQGQALGLLSV